MLFSWEVCYNVEFMIIERLKNVQYEDDIPVEPGGVRGGGGSVKPHFE